MARRFLPGVRERIIELRLEGKTFSEIKERLGCSEGGARWVCMTEGVGLKTDAPKRTTPATPFRRGNQTVRPFTEEEDATLIRLQGEDNPPSLSAIARLLNRGASSITARLHTLAQREEARLENGMEPAL